MENELILKLDKETTITLIEGLGKSAYAIAVAHGFRGTEQEWLNSLQGVPGPQGDNVNLETVKELKEFLLDNNVFVKSDSLEGIIFEYFKAGRPNFFDDQWLPEPAIDVNDGKMTIYYIATLPFQINDGEMQYMDDQNVEIPLPSTTEPITIKFYNARMKLRFTKTVEVQ